ncbi:hypothetical protein [uncultured Thiodictyon sp.]|uniref:hypothetical protein n=1 Tax=uncultured Thiodictyon sp. TaxID=1846217 RepID=UPI0025D66C86|nr:hypothetical protein [uncultured Thiodictyon sp.]
MRRLLIARLSLDGRPFLGLALLLLWVWCGVVLAYAWLGGAYGTITTFTLPPLPIVHQEGCAYLVKQLPRPGGWPLIEWMSDTRSTAHSQLVLSENGRPLPNPHATDAEIVRSGPGGYSHWREALLFSTPDCSDPRTNGRRYTAAAPWSPSGLGYALAFLLWGAVGFALAGGCIGAAEGTAWCRIGRGLFNRLFFPLDLTRRPWLAAAVALALLLCCWGLLAWRWRNGWSVDLSVAGFFPISDSSGYWRCANSLLDFGRLDPWCERRATYPTWLAGLNLLGGRHLLTTLALQAAVAAVAIFTLVRRLSPLVPGVATLVAAVLLVAYASVDLFPLTMTENAGLIFGCLGLALLLRAADERSLPWLAAGGAMLSLALNARAGAFFVLPALVLWAGWMAHASRRRSWWWVLVTVLAILAGFALQVGLVRAIGGDLAASHGNFAYTLYGLSVGGKGWSQVLIDHPELFAVGTDASQSHAVFGLAWCNITRQPTLFYEGLAANLKAFVAGGTYGFYRLDHAAAAVRLCWWFAWLPLLWRYRDPRYLMIALLSLGILASAPWLLGDGGPRVFAATVGVDALQIAIAIAVFAQLVAWLGGAKPVTEQTPPVRRSVLEPIVALLVLGILLLPFTPLARLAAAPRVPFNGCPEGQQAVATRMNRGGNISLSLVEDGRSADFLHGEVAREALLRGIRTHTWWRADVASFTGGALFHADQLGANDAAGAQHYDGYADTSLARYDGKLLGLCLDPHDSKTLFGVPYFRLRSLTQLE